MTYSNTVILGILPRSLLPLSGERSQSAVDIIHNIRETRKLLQTFMLIRLTLCIGAQMEPLAPSVGGDSLARAEIDYQTLSNQKTRFRKSLSGSAAFPKCYSAVSLACKEIK